MFMYKVKYMSCIISEIKRNIGLKIAIYFIPLLDSTPLLGGWSSDIAIPFGTEKNKVVCLPDGEKCLRICITVSIDRVPACDRQINRQTE